MTQTIPDFILIGATRCGTTSLYNYLCLHPEIQMSKHKETSFFNKDENFQQGLSYYSSVFDKLTNPEKIYGDNTPMYFDRWIYNEKGEREFKEDDYPLLRIKKSTPDVKLVLTLRNPLDRFQSSYWKSFRQGKIKESISEHIQKYLNELSDESSINNLLIRNRYEIMLANLSELFSRDQYHVMLFEEWTNDSTQLQKLFSFLGVDPSFDHPDFQKVHNTATKYKTRQKLKARIASLTGLNVDSQGKSGDYPDLTSRDKKILDEYFDSTYKYLLKAFPQIDKIW